MLRGRRRNVSRADNDTSIRSAGGEKSLGLAGRKFSKAKAIADRLSVCSRTIFRWADAGKIARRNINDRVVLFDEAEIAAFIESARVG